MTQSQKLRILLVDNQPVRLEGLRELLAESADVVIRDPFDVELDDLTGVDLVSVDEYLGDDWDAATSLGGDFASPASIRNRDGLAVAASFRSQARQTPAGEDALLFGVVLHTGELGRLANGLPPTRREALTAAQHDLEWVFEWGQDDFAQRLLSLANAVKTANSAASGLGNDFGAAWLSVPEQPWRDTARAQVEDCRPPVHVLAQATDGRSVVRWLAHRVLPYPTFLLDDNHAANLLGMTEESFQALSESAFLLRYQSEYVGPLSGFLGRRWWRAGLQQIMADFDVYQWDPPSERAAALSEQSGVKVVPLTSAQPVVAYDESGGVQTIDADPELSVRLQADGWPVFADDPWALIEDVAKNQGLRLLVTQAERHRVDGTG